MRNVLSKSEVAHYWAHQRQSSARVPGGNFYFEGKTIYSYGGHFPIASISEQDSHTVLFTTQSYSNTTAKHISEARSAASHKRLIYCYNPYSAAHGRHTENINQFEQEAKTIAGKLPKAKKPEMYLSQIAHQKRLLMEYVDFFKLKPTTYKHLHYINIVTRDGAIVATEKERKSMERAKKAQDKANEIMRAELLGKDQKILAEWRARKKPYTDNNTVYFYALAGTFLRFNKSTNEVETTKGVIIPIKVAERFYKWLKHQLKKGGCNGECEHKILGYDVNQVNSEGIKVGCHNVKWSEIDTMAKKLKWA